MGWAAAIPAIISAGTSIAGDAASRSANEDAKRARNNLADSWAGIALPDVEKQRLMYELPYLMGELSPLQEQAQQLDKSKMEDISISPELKAQQMQGLQALSELGDSGMNPQERAQLEQIRRAVAQEEQAKDSSILQNMQQRGVGGSGMELIQRLKAAQTGADRASQESMKIGADAQARRLAALQALGNQAGNIRGQEFGEQSAVAQAADTINKFNAQTRGDVQQRNIAVQNAAQAQNLANKQALQAQQIALKNQQQEKNKALYQQEFENAMARQSGASGVASNLLSKQYNQQGQYAPAVDAGNEWSQISKGATGIFGDIYKAPGK